MAPDTKTNIRPAQKVCSLTTPITDTCCYLPGPELLRRKEGRPWGSLLSLSLWLLFLLVFCLVPSRCLVVVVCSTRYITVLLVHNFVVLCSFLFLGGHSGKWNFACRPGRRRRKETAGSTREREKSYTLPTFCITYEDYVVAFSLLWHIFFNVVFRWAPPVLYRSLQSFSAIRGGGPGFISGFHHISEISAPAVTTHLCYLQLVGRKGTPLPLHTRKRCHYGTLICNGWRARGQPCATLVLSPAPADGRGGDVLPGDIKCHVPY